MKRSDSSLLSLGLLLISLLAWPTPATSQVAADTLQLLREAAARNPSDKESQKRLAARCMEMHLESEALAAATAASSLAPGDLEARGLMIRALARSGRYDDALDAARDERGVSATRDLGLILQSATQASLAQRRLEEALLSEQRGAFLEVTTYFERALRADPDNLSVRKTLGWVYLEKLHKPRAAYPHLVEVARQHPSDVEAKKNLALSLAQTGRLRRAAVAFREVLILEPEDAWMKVNLAKTIARLGDWSQAEALYVGVLRADPSNYYARLGQAELTAWRGQSSLAMRMLRELLNEKPDDPEARTLLADVYRWDWRLSESRSEYARVLGTNSDYSEALSGQKALQEAAGWSIRADAYHFTDSDQFTRSSVTGYLRVPLSDRMYLLGDAACWRFEEPAFSPIERVDGRLGLEFHPARWLEAECRAAMYNYEDRNPFFGAELSSKISIASRCDVYSIVSMNHPFVSSISTVYKGLREDSIGNGLDLKLGRGFSLQNSLQLSKVSDGNDWLEDKPQISYQLVRVPSVFVRVEDDYLTYSEQRLNYWTPHNRNVLSPVADMTIKIMDTLRFDATAKLPYVFDRSAFGFQTQIGLSCEMSRRVRLSASYIYNAVPGDQGPWSGSGWQASITFLF